MAKVILFNKPYGVLSQFTSEAGHPGLKDFIPVPSVYPAGRLDRDSEGLLVLTDDGRLQARIAHPARKEIKTYWVQVENIPNHEAMDFLARGVDLGDFVTRPCDVRIVDEPQGLWPRNPPVRYRAAIPTCWLEVRLREGKNRQIRRMTAKAGHPTLRIVRWAVGEWTLEGLAPGQWREIDYPFARQSCQPASGHRVIGLDARFSTDNVKPKSRSK